MCEFKHILQIILGVCAGHFFAVAKIWQGTITLSVFSTPRFACHSETYHVSSISVYAGLSGYGSVSFLPACDLSLGVCVSFGSKPPQCLFASISGNCQTLGKVSMHKSTLCPIGG